MKQIEIARELEEIRHRLDDQAPKPFTVEEASVYLGISRSTLYRYTSTSAIPHFKPTNKRCYFLKADLDAFLLRNRVATRDEIATEIAR